MVSALLSVENALDRLLKKAEPVSDSEIIALQDGDGRVLSEDLRSKITQPPFDASAMDGFAVQADVKAGDVLQVVGESAAGQMPAIPVKAGTAMRIFTGAPLPAGATTVIIQENTLRQDDGQVRIEKAAPAGANIRRAGQDFAKDQVVLPKEALLSGRSLSLAAASGHGAFPVFRKPRLAVLATGNELVPPGTLPGPGQISASGSVATAALARANGAEVIDLGIAADEENAILSAVENARAANADILVTIGGASVGDHDLVQPVLRTMGMTLDFWKVAMRPGKPLMVGSLGDMTVLGLPGNPVSSFVCMLLFGEPLIRKLAHLPPRNRATTAHTTVALPDNGPRQHFMRARFLDDEKQQVSVFESQDSSLLAALAKADCLVVRPPNAPAASKGDPVKILPLDGS